MAAARPAWAARDLNAEGRAETSGTAAAKNEERERRGVPIINENARKSGRFVSHEALSCAWRSTALGRSVLGRKRCHRTIAETTVCCSLVGDTGTCPIDGTERGGNRSNTLNIWREGDGKSVQGSRDTIGGRSANGDRDDPVGNSSGCRAVGARWSNYPRTHTVIPHVLGLLLQKRGGINGGGRCRQPANAIRLKGLTQYALGSRASNDAFTDLCPNRVILISRQGDSGQDTDDRHNDHQFDQGKTLLERTLHENPLGKVANAQGMQQILCQDFYGT